MPLGILVSELAFGSQWQQPQGPDPSIPADQQPMPLLQNPNQSQQPLPVPISPPPDRGPVVQSIKAFNLFGGAPPVPGTKRIMADGEAPEVYVVEPGDTLFDICAQLLDEPGYWPKLWSLNAFIRNPHFIYPGMRLRFYPGDDSTPPFLEVITEDDVIPVDKDELREEELVAQDISGLLMAFTEPSPTPVIGPGEVEATGEEFLAVGSYYSPDSTPVILPALIFAEEKEPLGRVVVGALGGALLDIGQRVVAEGDAISSGSAYLIVRESEEIYTKFEEEWVGYRYEVVGSISVKQALAEEEQFLAVVVESRLGLQEEDFLIQYQSIRKSVPVDYPAPSGGQGNEVVGFGYPYKVVGARGAFVMFEMMKGSLSVGQTVPIFQRFEQLSMLSDTPELPQIGETVAYAYIIDTSSQVAVGYVVKSEREVRYGDIVANN